MPAKELERAICIDDSIMGQKFELLQSYKYARIVALGEVRYRVFFDEDEQDHNVVEQFGWPHHTAGTFSSTFTANPVTCVSPGTIYKSLQLDELLFFKHFMPESSDSKK